MSDSPYVPSAWRVVLAAVLDFITIFLVGGFVVAALTGGTTETGFSLSGFPAVLLFALIIGYFVILGRYGGGTLWQRLLKAKARL